MKQIQACQLGILDSSTYQMAYEWSLATGSRGHIGDAALQLRSLPNGSRSLWIGLDSLKFTPLHIQEMSFHCALCRSLVFSIRVSSGSTEWMLHFINLPCLNEQLVNRCGVP